MSIQPGTGYTFTSSGQGTNLTIHQPWSPIPLYQQSEFVCSPYLVHDIQEKSGEGGTYVVFHICPGTFNNHVPQVYDTKNEVWQYLNSLAEDAELVLDFASTTSSYIYLRIGNNSGAFPPSSPTGGTDDPYPRIYCTGSALPADSDTFGYVLVAQVTNSSGVYSVTQYVTGSLWGDRLKLGTATAAYYYARI